MMKLSVGRQERFSRTLANLLLLALVLYLAVELAKLTWLVAWNDRPVPEIFGQTAAGAEVRSRVSGAPIAGYEFFGRPDNQKGVADVVRQEGHVRWEGHWLRQHTEEHIRRTHLRPGGLADEHLVDQDDRSNFRITSQRAIERL